MDEYQIKNFLKFAPARLGLAPKKRLFIHIPKNGGMSIRQAPQLQGNLVLAHRRRLKSKSYANALRDHMASTGAQPGYEHARLRDVDVSVRKGTKAFAIVRNPWSRTVSRFKFALQTRNHDGARPEISKATFEEFLQERETWLDEPFFWHRAIRGWYPQADYVLDENNEIGADILRQEFLGEELKTFLQIDGTLEKRNISKSTHSGYRDLYDDRTIQLIADWYVRDIEIFGFDFDTAATKNICFDPGKRTC